MVCRLEIGMEQENLIMLETQNMELFIRFSDNAELTEHLHNWSASYSNNFTIQ